MTQESFRHNECVKLTSEEGLPATAALHAQQSFLRCRHRPSEAGNKGGAGVQVPTDPVLGVNDRGLGRSTAHECGVSYSCYQ